MQIKNLLYIGFILKKLKRSQSHFSDSDSLKRSDSVSLLRSLLIGWLDGFWERAIGRSAAAPGGWHQPLMFCISPDIINTLPYVFISWIWMSLHFYPDLISLNNTFIIYARDTPPFVQSIQWCASMAFWIHRIPIFNFAKSGILYFRLNWNRTEVFDITMSSLQDCEVNQSDTVVSKAIQKEICSKSFMQKENPVL